MRVYGTKKVDLLELPNNPKNNTLDWTNQGDFNGVCPKTAAVRTLNITASTAKRALPGGTLVYNPRPATGGRLHDPTAIMYFRTSDLDATTGVLKPGVVIEPLMVRASAGECIEVTLKNNLPPGPQFDLDGFNTMPMIVDDFNANQVKPSSDVGLHPQMVFLDITRSDGMNVGFNPVQTASPGGTVTYQWYAGDIMTGINNTGVPTAVEYGSTNLSPSDPIKHTNKGVQRYDLPRVCDDVPERYQYALQRYVRRSDEREWYRRSESCRSGRSGRLGTEGGQLSHRAALETHGLRAGHPAHKNS
jgi:hypothetical protein